jgi:protein SCO1/2
MIPSPRSLVLILASALFFRPGAAQGFPAQFAGIGIQQQLGSQLPLDTEFRDQAGTPVRLGKYFGKKPVLLVPVYYTCPTLCDEALRGVVEGISPLALRPGRDFEIVAFSFNPAEKPADARKKLDECTMNYAGRRGLPGWHFLTGAPFAIARLTRAVGFHYREDTVHHMFVHASGMLIASPDGRISHYLFGVEYEPRDLRNGILSAAQRRLLPTETLRLLCYRFSSSTGRFNRIAIFLLRLGASLTILALAAGLVVLCRNDRRQPRIHPAPEAGS